MTSSSEIAIDIKNVSKLYGDFVALDDVSLAIEDNEFFTLLGPSGCGKTTLLRTIAGFESLSKGSIHLFGESLSDLPPNKRPVNTVFQQYALFPHMTVTENVMFGLLRKKVSESEARTRAGEMLEMVQLSAFADRVPSKLSGGQQQRVALARALAPKPRVLLLDEPLSALDLKLRQDVRVELQQIQHNTGITFIFVTHDQEEAIAMSDRIAIIRDGLLQQVGAPKEVYENPQNRFVADFVGETNFIDVNISAATSQQLTCELVGGGSITCPNPNKLPGGTATLSIRPERLELATPDDASLSGEVTRLIYLGTDIHVFITLDNGQVIKLRLQNNAAAGSAAVGDRVGLRIDAQAARVLVN